MADSSIISILQKGTNSTYFHQEKKKTHKVYKEKSMF